MAEVQATKPFWQSKTFWMSLAVAVVPALSQSVRDSIAANPAIVESVLGGVFLVLRMVSNGKITIS